MDDFKFNISDKAREYLVLQKGALWSLKDEKETWETAYNASLNNTFKTLLPFLPERCENLLDVGSGLSGISALLNRHYGGGVGVSLIDGVNDAPVVISHNKPFNDMNVARAFLFENGVRRFNYFSPSETKSVESKVKFDLVTSFGAWCFHFPPFAYLNFVTENTDEGSTIILDVRNDKPNWLEFLDDALGPNRVIREAKKFTKRIWIRK